MALRRLPIGAGRVARQGCGPSWPIPAVIFDFTMGISMKTQPASPMSQSDWCHLSFRQMDKDDRALAEQWLAEPMHCPPATNAKNTELLVDPNPSMTAVNDSPCEPNDGVDDDIEDCNCTVCWVYILSVLIGTEWLYKYGRSNNVQRRIDEHCQTYDAVELICSFPCGSLRASIVAESIIADILARLGLRRYHNVGGIDRVELFTVTDIGVVTKMVKSIARLVGHVMPAQDSRVAPTPRQLVSRTRMPLADYDSYRGMRVIYIIEAQYDDNIVYRYGKAEVLEARLTRGLAGERIHKVISILPCNSHWVSAFAFKYLSLCIGECDLRVDIKHAGKQVRHVFTTDDISSVVQMAATIVRGYNAYESDPKEAEKITYTAIHFVDRSIIPPLAKTGNRRIDIM